LGFSLAAYTQEGLPLLTYFYSENLPVAHPALTGVNLMGPRLLMSSNQQWMDQKNAPKTMVLSLDSPLGKNNSIGGIFYQDQNGNYQRNGVLLTYAYRINLSEEVWNTRRSYHTKDDQVHQLNLGMSIGNFNALLDTGDFFGEYIDPLLNNTRLTEPYTNFNVGIAYISTKLSAQISFKNFPLSTAKSSLFLSPLSVTKKRFNHYLLSAQYRLYTENEWTIEPAFTLQYFPSGENRIHDFSCKVYKLFRQGRAWAGVSYRTDFKQLASQRPLAQNQQFSTITPLFGVNYRNIQLVYQYANPGGDVQLGLGGTHSLMLGIQIY